MATGKPDSRRTGQAGDARTATWQQQHGWGGGGRGQGEAGEQEGEGGGQWGRGGDEPGKQISLLKILYTNVQSLPSKLNELEVAADILKPDLILLTETWLNSSVSNAALSLAGYVLQSDLRVDKTESGIGGGLIVYSRRGLEVCSTDKFTDCNFTQFVEFSIGGKANVVLVYRSPNSDQANTENFCNLIRNMDKNTLIIGDVNLPGINWEEGTAYARGRGVLDAAVEAGAEQLVNFPTHIKGNILDLVITNIPDAIVSISDTGRIGKSDHCCLLIETDICVKKKISKSKRQDWKKADLTSLREFLQNVDWGSIMENLDTERAWDSFKEIISEATSVFVPLSTCRTRDTPPWLNREVVRLVKRKKKAWKTLKTYSTKEARDHYAKLERETTKKSKMLKEDWRER